jgi:cytochrome P450
MQAWGLQRGLPFTEYRASVDARERIIEYLRPILADAVKRYNAGDRPARSSLSELLDACTEKGLEIGVGAGDEFESLLYNIGFLMFAGTDTTLLSMLEIVKGLVRNPEVLEKAAEEQRMLIDKFGEKFDRHVCILCDHVVLLREVMWGAPSSSLWTCNQRELALH